MTTTTLTQDWAALEAARETVEKIQTAVYELARENAGAVMGDYAWLRYAISQNDLTVQEVNDKFVYVYGHAFTCQTMSQESFEFQVPTALVQEHMQQQD